MAAHLLQHMAPDHQEAGAGVAHPREAVDHDHVIRVLDLQHIIQRRRSNVRPAALDESLRLVPIDPLDRIRAGDHVRGGINQAEHLFRRKADIGVDEQQMCRGGVLEEQRDQIGPGPRDQRVAVSQLNRQFYIGPGAQYLLQMQHRGGKDGGNLAAKAGRGHHEVDALRHGRHRRDKRMLRLPSGCGQSRSEDIDRMFKVLSPSRSNLRQTHVARRIFPTHRRRE